MGLSNFKRGTFLTGKKSGRMIYFLINKMDSRVLLQGNLRGERGQAYYPKDGSKFMGYIPGEGPFSTENRVKTFSNKNKRVEIYLKEK